jgi:glutamate synthase (NADPH/NADH) large chain
MTGGRVVVLGSTGRNFAAGMSGGVAYVSTARRDFARFCNVEMVDLEPLDDEDLAFVHDLVARHVGLTGSRLGARLLSDWRSAAPEWTKVMPRDYKRALAMQPVEPSAAVSHLKVVNG